MNLSWKEFIEEDKHWLSKKEDFPDAAISKEGDTDCLCEPVNINFLEKKKKKKKKKKMKYKQNFLFVNSLGKIHLIYWMTLVSSILLK